MSKLAELYVTIRADSKQLAAGLQSVKGLTAGVAQNITNVGVAAAASFYAFERAAKYVLGAYAAQEEAELRLRTAIRLRGMEGMGVEEMVVQFANARQAVTTFGDEVTMQAAAMAMRFNAIRADNLEPFLKLSQDLAAMTRQDLSSAVMSLGMALENPSMGFLRLRRAGIMFTVQEQEMIREMVKLGKTADAQAAILDKVKSKVEGMAEAYAKTFAGRAARIGNEIGDMAENLGQVIAEKLGGSMEKLIAWLTKFKEAMVGGGGMIPGLMKMVGATLGFATAIAVASRALAFFRSVLWGSLGPLGWIAAGIAALAAKYLNLEDVMGGLERAWKSLTDWMESKRKVFDEIAVAAKSLLDRLMEAIGVDPTKLGEIWEWAKVKVEELAIAILEFTRDTLNYLDDFVAGAKLRWAKFAIDAIVEIMKIQRALIDRLPKWIWTAAALPGEAARMAGEVAGITGAGVRGAATLPISVGGAAARAAMPPIAAFQAASRWLPDILGPLRAVMRSVLAPAIELGARYGLGPLAQAGKMIAGPAIQGALGVPLSLLQMIGQHLSIAAASGQRLSASMRQPLESAIAIGESLSGMLAESIAAKNEEAKKRREERMAEREAARWTDEWRRELEEKGKGTMGGRQGPPLEEEGKPDIARAVAQEKKKEEQWATGFVGLADFAKQFQAAVLKPDKALEVARDQLKEQKDINVHLDDMAKALDKRYSAFGTQLA